MPLMIFFDVNEPCQNVTTTWGQLVIFLGMLLNVWAQSRRAKQERTWQIEDKEELKRGHQAIADKVTTSAQEAASSVVSQTKEALDEQTQAIKAGVQTRLADLGVRFDNILQEERRRKDD